MKTKISNRSCRALYDKGLAYFEGNGVGRNTRTAMKYIERSAELDCRDAEIFLGWWHYYHTGEKKRGIEWYKKAALHGHPGAQVIVGEAYENGIGKKNDLKKAIALYRNAAKKGDGLGQLRLAVAYYHGKGRAKNVRNAIKWYRRATANGVSIAQYRLGYFLERGNGVRKDAKEAMQWYRRAAKNGIPEAIRRVEKQKREG